MGDRVGALLGDALGTGVGTFLIKVGDKVGAAVGALLGDALGSGVGTLAV